MGEMELNGKYSEWVIWAVSGLIGKLYVLLDAFWKILQQFVVAKS